MTPIGTVIDVKQVQGPQLISLYNLYPSATVAGSPAPGFSSGEALDLMDQIGRQELPPGTGYEWTAMSYQEKAVGNQMYFVFGLALLLVYFVLAGQYESWILPLAVILGVPLALLGTVGALTALGVPNNLYTQIGLILLIALGSKNAILVVEYARQRRAEGMEIVTAAVEGARLRFSANSHDLVRLYSGRLPAGRGNRSGRRRTAFDRPARLQRHDLLDLPGRGVRPLILCGDAAPAGAMDQPRPGGNDGTAARVASDLHLPPSFAIIGLK